MKAITYTSLTPKLFEEWKKLWEDSAIATYTNSPYWFVSVIESFHYKKYAIVCIYEEEKIISVAALIREKKYGVDFYTIAPNDFVYGLPFIVDLDNEAQVLLLKEELSKLGNIFLTNIAEDFVNAFNKHGLPLDSFVQSINYNLPITFDSNGIVHIYRRNKLMHEIRGLHEKFTLLAFDGDSKDGMNAVFELDKISRKQDRGYSAFATEEIRNLYTTLGKNFKEHMQVHILYYEEVPIAYEIGFFVGKTYFGSQMAYISAYKQYSPGKVILVKVIDLLASKGIRLMDMGSGDSPIKKLVTEQTRTLYEVVLSSNKISKAYIKNAGKLREYLYNQIHANVKAYSAYKRIKKLIK